MNQTWEYRTLIFQNLPSDVAPQMNKLGAEGWELVAATVTSRDAHLFYFKRLK